MINVCVDLADGAMKFVVAEARGERKASDRIER